MLNKTYLLTASRNPGFKLGVPPMRAPRFGEAFRRCRERSKKASPYQVTKARRQRNKPNRQFKKRYQSC